MDARLDPGCEGARALVRKHADQEALLVAGSQGQLASIVRTTQEAQVRQHLVACARCRHYDPKCAECGFDPQRERHGWRCSRQGSRWADWLPWNWRPKRAPPAPAAPTWKHVTKPPPEGAYAARRVPVQDTRGATQTAAVARPVTPKPRPRPQAPAPSSLALAYAALGLSAEATQDAVRSAYRQRAQQYHPDKVAQLAPEFKALADQKMTEINAAYERIKRSWT